MLAFALAATTHRWRGSTDCCRTLVSATATLRQTPSCSQPSRCSSRFESSTGTRADQRFKSRRHRCSLSRIDFSRARSLRLARSIAPPSRGRRWSRILTGGPGCAAPRSSRRSENMELVSIGKGPATVLITAIGLGRIPDLIGVGHRSALNRASKATLAPTVSALGDFHSIFLRFAYQAVAVSMGCFQRCRRPPGKQIEPARSESS
jgi:hypothetical protein